MIERFPVRNRNERMWLLDLISKTANQDFYFYDNGSRNYIVDDQSLKNLFKNSSHVFIKKEKGDYVGIVLVNKENVSGEIRHYIKIVAKNNKIAEDILTVLLWNFPKQLFAKIRNDSRFVSVLKQKGFRFDSEKGCQLLLVRKPVIYNKVFKIEEDELERTY